MILCDVKIGGYLFEDEGILCIGNKCLVQMNGYYFIGILHSYTTVELCFKECIYFMKEEDEYIPWVQHSFKPYHWIDKENVFIWPKSTAL